MEAIGCSTAPTLTLRDVELIEMEDINHKKDFGNRHVMNKIPKVVRHSETQFVFGIAACFDLSEILSRSP